MRVKKRHLSLTIQVVLFLICLCLFETVFARDAMNSPFGDSPRSSQKLQYQTSTVKWVWKGAISFYSRIVSPADGPRSPSYPTGSAYGRQAIERYGFFWGIILTADRLLHEADLNLGPTVIIYGKRRIYDPLEYNTLWWDKPKKSTIR